MAQTLNLTIYEHEQMIEHKTLTRDVIKIGRLESSHVCLEDDSVARMHAVIEATGSDVRIIDLGSSTGTLVNDQRVEKTAALVHGDMLKCGPYRIEVQLASQADAPPVFVDLPSPMAAEVEVLDGTAVAEVMSIYGATVLDVQHVGQIESRRRSAPGFFLLGSALILTGASVFAYEVSRDWGAHQEAVRNAAHTGRPKPQEPGLGLGGLGIGLALLGLVPFGFGVVRLQDVGLSEYTIGEGEHIAFPTPTQGLPDQTAFSLVRGGVHGEATLHFTAGMTGDVTVGDQRLTLAELVVCGHASSVGAAYAFPLPTGARCRVGYAGLTFHVNAVPRGRLTAQKSEVDKQFWLYNAATFAVMGTFLVMTHLIPDDALEISLGDLSSESRFVGYMNQPDETPDEEPDEQPSVERETSAAAAGSTGQRHAGPEGKMGNPVAKKAAGLSAMKGPKDAILQMARNFDPDMTARNIGILGMIQQESGHFLASPHGGAFAVGHDDADVWGNLTGTEIGEAFGVGGLSLVGTGRQGGGTGEGTIGLGHVGRIGTTGTGGSGSHYGGHSGTGFDGRPKRGPRVREAKVTAKGPIDKDIIRRIVRAHINEVRHCYNQGLVRDPNLAGRVEVQFTVGPTGKVPLAVVQQSSLEDKNVANCVTKAVRRWTFPKPHGGGHVMVTYPFVLSPG